MSSSSEEDELETTKTDEININGDKNELVLNWLKHSKKSTILGSTSSSEEDEVETTKTKEIALNGNKNELIIGQYDVSSASDEENEEDLKMIMTTKLRRTERMATFTEV